MRLSIYIIIAFVMSIATPATATELQVMQKKDKYGYCDSEGKIVIKAKYSHAYPFENGMAKVFKNDKCGFINEQGKEVIPVEYDLIEDFVNGIALVKKGKKYGYIKNDGSFYIKPEYDFIGAVNKDGYVWVAKGKTLETSAKGLFRNGTMVIAPKHRSLGFYNVTDSVDYTSGNPISHENGLPVNNEINKNLVRISSPDIPYIWTVLPSGKTRIYDLDGNILFMEMTGACGAPREGLALTRSYSKKKEKSYYSFNYYIEGKKGSRLFKKDITQELDMDNLYEACQPFINGLALVGDGKIFYLADRNGRAATTTYRKLSRVEDLGYISLAVSEDKYGILDLDGKQICDSQFSYIGAPAKGERVFPARKADSYGFIDITGNEVIPFRYQDARSYIKGRGFVKDNGAYGAVDNTGKFLVSPRWSMIYPSVDSDLCWVKSPESDKWRILDISSDKTVGNDEFDDAWAFDKSNEAYVKKDGLIGRVGADGDLILPIIFTDYNVAGKAREYLTSTGNTHMREIDAFRFNVYNNPDRHKYRLHQQIEENMWDY